MTPSTITDRSDHATEQPAARPRGRMGRLTGFRVAGMGSYLPAEIVTNQDLAALGCDSDWILRRTGMVARRRAADHQATSDLAYEAAADCLARSGVDAGEVDLIIVATITPDHPTPSTACLLQERLGAVAPAMDISAACAGFMYAMITAAQFVATGNARCALVVGADLMTRTIDPGDKRTYPLFGDAAGAMLMTGDGEANQGILSYQMGSEGNGRDLLCVRGGGSRVPLTPQGIDRGDQFMRMDGRNVFKWAVRVVDESATDVLSAAKIKAEDLDSVILHQANQRIIDSAVAALGVAPDRVFANLRHYGNTSAASIPVAIDEALASGRIATGSQVLLCGFGAGLAWGTAVMRW